MHSAPCTNTSSSMSGHSWRIFSISSRLSSRDKMMRATPMRCQNFTRFIPYMLIFTTLPAGNITCSVRIYFKAGSDFKVMSTLNILPFGSSITYVFIFTSLFNISQNNLNDNISINLSHNKHQLDCSLVVACYKHHIIHLT